MHTELSENPNCSETNATFRLVGDLVDPSQITLLTGAAPLSAARKGETHVGSHTKKTYEYKTGAWCVSSEDVVESTSIERHLVFLLDILEPKKESIKKLIKQLSIRADFHIYWVSATGTGGPVISADTLRRIADLNADLDFEFQGPYEDDDEDES